VIRKRIGKSDYYTEIGARDVFFNKKYTNISITLAQNGAQIYVNGELKEVHPNF